MIPQFLQEYIDPEYWALLEHASASGNYTAIALRIEKLSAIDSLMQPFDGESGTKYYKSFVQTVVPKILQALQSAIDNNKPPEINISFEEIDETRDRLGIGPFGSPQDVLYGFTSERYPNWGETVFGMGFKSACMSEPTRAVLTMAPRYLELSIPDTEVQELPGTISKEFIETHQIVFGDMPFLRRYQFFCENVGIDDLSAAGQNQTTVDAIISQLENLGNDLTERGEINRQILQRQITEFVEAAPSAQKIRRFLTAVHQATARVSQEQLVLKYVTEGNYLQKILEGDRVEHIQSNVKMVPNILRDNKCEVDAIYRVVGQKRILLLEAKGKDKIARAQLYGVYETFRSRLPIDWDLDIVAAMLTDPTDEQRANGVTKCIDLVRIGLENHLPLTFTERLLQVSPDHHYRWLIR